MITVQSIAPSPKTAVLAPQNTSKMAADLLALDSKLPQFIYLGPTRTARPKHPILLIAILLLSGNVFVANASFAIRGCWTRLGPGKHTEVPSRVSGRILGEARPVSVRLCSLVGPLF